MATDGGKERVKKMNNLIPDIVADQSENEVAYSDNGNSQTTTYLLDYASPDVHSRNKENASINVTVSSLETPKIEQIAFEL